MTLSWHRRQEIPDPLIRDAANQFESARKLLWMQPPGSGLLYPLMNTATVAIELYLRCLSAEKVYSDSAGRGPTRSAKPAILRSHVLTTLHDDLSTFGGLSFRDALSQFEGAFHESRYPFEPDSDTSKHPLALLMNCSNFLQQFVAHLQTKDKIRS
jgi:hypothetical protein